MASSKKKTTMNKLNRERKLRERRVDKQAKKLARANGLLETPVEPGDELQDELGEPAEPLAPATPIN
jgi:hypothetical protein